MRQQGPDGGDMALGKIHDMDVVAHTRAIGRVVIVAEYVEVGQQTGGHTGDERHQVVRNPVGILADQPGFVGADRVEVAQAGNAPLRIRAGDVGEHLLDVQFGAAVGVRGGSRMCLVDRQVLRIAIDRGARAEYQRLYPGGLHRLQQADRALDIVRVILDRLCDGFADGLEPRKMYDGPDFMRRECLAQCCGIPQIRLDEGDTLASQLADAVDHRRPAVAEVVEDHHLVLRTCQRNRCVAADIPGASGEKNVHEAAIPVRFCPEDYCSSWGRHRVTRLESRRCR